MGSVRGTTSTDPINENAGLVMTLNKDGSALSPLAMFPVMDSSTL
jgi:hypothetical protein